ncbi:EAL domain-containing protein [Candidimonas sp. SYP-B2681]|uniref:putative bifunctional diguanylate cyclase/phosphodiesterase n=1 Tax=Candidimonas sp. SYP-B2681 TaxID=2497686 RepID=UPI000F87A6BA|nr:EAL domain-containing protein [Candidimonas sp. SYP-B2681]RTZ45596.1 EAL domain-containing protein [Candidimonas sp. SYP-B2681]
MSSKPEGQLSASPDGGQRATSRWRVIGVVILLASPLLWLSVDDSVQVFARDNVNGSVHTVLEVCEVVIASMIFALGWHSVNRKMPRNIIILSGAFLAIALLDLCQLLTLPIGPIASRSGTQAELIYFGIASRAVGAAALLTVAFLPHTKFISARLRYVAFILPVSIVILAAWIALYRTDILTFTLADQSLPLPVLTGIQYAVVAGCSAAALVMLRRGWAHKDQKVGYLVIAATAMALSEAFFLQFSPANDLPGLAGHIYELVAYGCVYYWLFLQVVRAPYERLHRSERFRLRQLTHDTMTGLPKRSLIVQKLRHAIAQTGRSNTKLAIFFLDIDFFKKVNATFGHSVGDQVIRLFVVRMASALSSDDTLARQEGDEFIILQSKIPHRHQAALLAESLLHRLREPFHIQGHEIFLSASIGITMFPEDDTTEHGLLHKAHMAMNSVKKDARNSYRFHTRDMENSLRERALIESSLRQALANNELLLHYQPKVDFRTGTIVGVEALLRWHHPVLGQVPPSRFIPIAEENGCISAIGMWVLKEACAQMLSWQIQGLPRLRISVNLSARQFQQAGLAALVSDVLKETGLDPALLELEITESTVMHDTEAAISALASLKKLGVMLSIDDFGTGYSSLSYLKRFPIDVLKIDRSFVSDVTHDFNDAAITKAIIALAHGLDLSVLAEGVETLEQALFLKANGCNEMQGFYFSEPVMPQKLADMVRSMPMPSMQNRAT